MACGVGATSVREWLPKGATFPNPPTIETNVRKVGDIWECKGDIYATFRDRMKGLGPNGFRAVLWHQGESDANQKDAARTLPGKLYRESLERLIRDTRKDLGRDAPWFVARASYHGPGDEGSADVRDAQASLWKDGIALEGPDTDALKGEWRDGGGKGVHFSGPGLREHEVVAAAMQQLFGRHEELERVQRSPHDQQRDGEELPRPIVTEQVAAVAPAQQQPREDRAQDGRDIAGPDQDLVLLQERRTRGHTLPSHPQALVHGDPATSVE